MLRFSPNLAFKGLDKAPCGAPLEAFESLPRFDKKVYAAFFFNIAVSGVEVQSTIEEP